MSSIRAVPLLLDTHVWVDYILGLKRLKQETIKVIEAARQDGVAYVSVISIWEIALLVRKRKLRLPMGVSAWTEGALQLPGVQLLPFSAGIAIESVDLPDEMHKDPADRILVASARVENLTLLTRDKAILRFAKNVSMQHLKA